MYQGSQPEIHCPRCNAVAYRVRRRWVDRLASLFRPVHRFQCQDSRCRWAWNIPVTSSIVHGVRRHTTNWPT